MAAAHDHTSPPRFRLLGIIHGHFDWEDKAPDGSMDSSERRLDINMGIAMVISSEKILRGLEVFIEEEEKEAKRERGKERSCTVM
jgi:hypothetical protein